MWSLDGFWRRRRKYKKESLYSRFIGSSFCIICNVLLVFIIGILYLLLLFFTLQLHCMQWPSPLFNISLLLWDVLGVFYYLSTIIFYLFLLFWTSLQDICRLIYNTYIDLNTMLICILSMHPHIIIKVK